METQENSENNCGYLLKSGNKPHVLTYEDRSRGGSKKKFNALKHGKHAKKLSKAYVCNDCGALVSTDRILKQDAQLMKLATRKDLFNEIVLLFSEMKRLQLRERNTKVRFLMTEKIIDKLLKFYEKAEKTLSVEEQKIDVDAYFKRYIDNPGKFKDQLKN